MITRGKAKLAQALGDKGDRRLGNQDKEQQSEMRQLLEVNLTTQQQNIVTSRASTPSGGGSADEKTIPSWEGLEVQFPCYLVL